MLLSLRHDVDQMVTDELRSMCDHEHSLKRKKKTASFFVIVIKMWCWSDGNDKLRSMCDHEHSVKREKKK